MVLVGSALLAVAGAVVVVPVLLPVAAGGLRMHCILCLSRVESHLRELRKRYCLLRVHSVSQDIRWCVHYSCCDQEVFQSLGVWVQVEIWWLHACQLPEFQGALQRSVTLVSQR